MREKNEENETKWEGIMKKRKRNEREKWRKENEMRGNNEEKGTKWEGKI